MKFWKHWHPVTRAMRRIATYCAKRYDCDHCLLKDDKGDCLIRDYDCPPDYWPVRKDELR